MFNKIDKLTETEFTEVFGNIFENASWIAVRLYKQKPFYNYNNLCEKIVTIFEESDNHSKLNNPELYISTEEVAELIEANSDTILLDGRNEEQFYAKAKHGKALAAGRLPGAILISQANSYLDGDNKLKSVEELSEIYSSALGGKDTVSYCNTGHWAATNWFVVSEVLGKKNTRLYDGSMVEWSNNTSLPLETSGPSNLDKLKTYF